MEMDIWDSNLSNVRFDRFHRVELALSFQPVLTDPIEIIEEPQTASAMNPFL